MHQKFKLQYHIRNNTKSDFLNCHKSKANTFKIETTQLIGSKGKKMRKPSIQESVPKQIKVKFNYKHQHTNGAKSRI